MSANQTAVVHDLRPPAEDAPGRDVGHWRRRAACQGEDPELFFPVGSAGPALAQIAEAKKICARCLVSRACLAFAMTTGQQYGIWGGLTEDERRQLRPPSSRVKSGSGACPVTRLPSGTGL